MLNSLLTDFLIVLSTVWSKFSKHWNKFFDEIKWNGFSDRIKYCLKFSDTILLNPFYMLNRGLNIYEIKLENAIFSFSWMISVFLLPIVFIVQEYCVVHVLYLNYILLNALTFMLNLVFSVFYTWCFLSSCRWLTWLREAGRFFSE